ncbi:hypothetical protein [Cyclobacterium sp.]|uniref:hypothetical protein n=1 Tax=Cyclobacterium sp. TaxID=1966343 RepID=UPI0019A706EA|nr:hypothetical protein [Cyclobacterium sp.]MBD3630870.1 hypothetical protein [Cyclobacterium sp.]
MKKYLWYKVVFLFSVFCFSLTEIHAQETRLPELPFHLTAKPWQPSLQDKSAFLDAIAATCQVVALHQNASGAIIDPYLNREHQYATPYFAFAVGVLLKAGRGEGLKEAGILAMEHSTGNFAVGTKSIPDEHGEFFISPLAHALDLYRPHISSNKYQLWEDRMKTPLAVVMQNFDGRINNWRTYAMKGEWSRVKLGLVDRDQAVAFIETAWHELSQRVRIMSDKWNLYQDWSSAPQSLAVEAVGRGNLIGLVMEGYDGPSAEEMKSAIRRGTQTSLLLQAPDGQAPANGRTDNHIFNDVLYQLAFESLAEDALSEGDSLLAGQYRRAANLAFNSILRWQRTDQPWEGSFYITKNHFEPGLRVGYQPASQWGNYTGATIQHLSEAWLSRQSDILEEPAPTEIGGYALETDDKFGAFFANAGGLQVVANLRGASIPKYNLSWTPLGVIRFSKKGWDARLGPSDGEHDLKAGTRYMMKTGSGDTLDTYRRLSGVTFGPEWVERDHWVRIADLAANYQAIPEIHFVHPLLVKFTLHYSYVTGRGGPYFKQHFTLTPDLVVSRLSSPQSLPYGLTVPLLENDGRPLQTGMNEKMVYTGYEQDGDRQYFISLNKEAQIHSDAEAIRSTYGWLTPVRFESKEPSVDLMVYPKSPENPDASDLLASFSWTEDGFSTAMAEVGEKSYIGLTAAGGEGKEMDLNGDGLVDVSFNNSCQFVLQLENNKVIRAEADREVILNYQGEEYHLPASQPIDL